MTYLSDDQSVHDGAPIELYKFEGPTSAFDFFYTSHYEDVEYNGDVYTAIPVEREAVESGTSNDPPELVVRLPASADIAQQYVFRTPPRTLDLTIYRMHLPTDQVPVLWTGLRKPNVEVYLPGKPASGNVVGEIAATVLTPVNTPGYRQTFGVPAVDSAQFTLNTTDSFDAANAGVHDFDDVAFAILVVASSDANPAGGQSVIGKREPGGGTLGYECVQLNDDRLRVNYFGAGALVIRFSTGTVPNDSTPFYFLNGISVTEAEAYLESSIGGSAPGSTAGMGSLTSTALFSLGSDRVNAFGGDIALVMIWSGADAEFVLANRALLPTWWAWASTVSAWLMAPELGDAVSYWKGAITGISVSGGVASFRSPSFIEDPLRTTIPSVTFQGLCNHVLYDDNCKLLATVYRASATVVSISGDDVVVDAVGGHPDDYYKGGVMVRPSDGDRRLILKQIGTTITLNRPLRDLVAPNVVYIYAGCPHVIDVCRDKFFNVVNYGGHPYIPNVNPFLRGFRAGGS